jgi:Helix-turn-helix domain
MNTLTLEQAATFLKMHPEEVRCRAKRGLIPASKPGRRWVFIDDDLAAFLRGIYPSQRQALRVTSEKGSAPWASVNEAASGGSTSRHHQASEYEEVLKLVVGPKRANITTG